MVRRLRRAAGWLAVSVLQPAWRRLLQPLLHTLWPASTLVCCAMFAGQSLVQARAVPFGLAAWAALVVAAMMAGREMQVR